MKLNKKKAKSLTFLFVIILSTTIINATLYSIYNGNIDNADQNTNPDNIEEVPEEKPTIRTSSNTPPNVDYFNYYKIITIDHNKVSGTGSHLNFPLLISIFDLDLQDDVQSDGDDIAFANDTAWLDHEIELFNQTYNATHAKLVAWVRVPTLFYDKDTKIYMYYGNSTMTSRENPTRVWDDNYMGVWHLEEDAAGTGTPNLYKDSASNGNHGEDQISDTGKSGKIGNGQSFDGSDDYIDLGSDPSLGVSTPFTISAWIKYYGDSTTYPHTIFANGDDDAKYTSFLVRADRLNVRVDGGGADGSGNTVLSTGVTYYAVFVHEGGNLHFYLDGGTDGDISCSTNIPTGNKHIGKRRESPSMFFDGIIDELRVSNSVRDADWIATEYNNQDDPESFYSISAPYDLFPPKPEYFNFYKIFTIDHKKVSGNTDLIDFPLLISILDSDLRDQVQPDGDDIVFSNGTDFSNGAIWLDHEIEYFSQTYNPSYAKLVAWVHVPTLFHDKVTKIYMYYGNSTMTSRENPTRVWDDDYMGVWHLSEVSGGIDAIKDSTTNGNSGTDQGSVELGATGQIGGAIRMYDYQDYINIPDSSSLDRPSSYITVSAWTNADYYIWNMPVLSKDEFKNSPYGILYQNSSNVIGYNLEGVTTSYVNSDVSITRQGWMHVVLTYDGSNVRIYKDGSLSYSASQTGTIAPNNANLKFGREEMYGDWFLGFLDEIRISDSVRSTEWITTEYNNQNDPNSFYSVSSRIHVKRPNPEDFQYQKIIPIDHTKVSGSSNLINFPVLISIFDEDLHDDVQPDGDDISFWNGSAWLDHEIELFNQNYNGTHAQLVAWVQIPSLSPSIDTIIFMMYSNSSLCSQEVPTGVWDSNYEGVWHLLESNGDAKDSTLSNEYGAVSGTVTQGSTGQINGAYDLDTDGMVNVGDPTDGHLDFGPNNNFTISFWINVDASTGTYQFPLYKGGASPSDVGYNFETSQTANELTFYICDGTNRQGSDTVGIIFDNWIYITGVVDKTNDYIHIYKDGTEVGSGTSISTIGNLTNNKVLRFSWDNYELNGLLDEIRISNICYSSDWIATEYNNQDNPSSFYTIGIEQLVGLANIQVNAKDLYGLPVPNANVSIHNTYGIIKSALTDSDGSVLFQNIDLGEYNFTVNLTSNIAPYETVIINTTSKAFEINESFHSINLICNASRNIFELTDVDGEPVESGWIIVGKGTDIQNCTIDETGQATFRWLNTTEYQYTVWYRDDNYNPNEIILASGEILSANSTIELQVNLTTVDFTVYTKDGSETIGGAKLMLENTTSGSSVVNFTTDFDGKVIFRWLNTSNFYNYSLKIRFYGEFKNFTMSGVGDAQGPPFQLEFSISANASYLIYLELTSQTLKEYETAIVSLNPTDNIMVEWGTNLTLRALFNVTKVPTGNTGPINADLMWYEIYDSQSTLIQSATMSIETGNIGRYQCKIKTNGLQSNIIYTIYIKAYKSEYILPDDKYISLYLLKNEIILNQSENDDSIQTTYWQESINMSVTSYGKISEDFTIEDEIFHNDDDPFQFVIPDISNDWNLSRIIFNIYNISWNVAEEAYINITILGPYDEFLKVDKNNASAVGSTYDYGQGWWTGIKFELNEISPMGDNTFKFTIGGTFDGPVDIIAEAFFIRDKVNVEYRKFNVTGDTISILSDGNGWAIKNITFDIYNCYNTTNWSPILDIPTVLSKISPYEGQNYTLVKTGDYTARISIDNITIYPFEDVFLFDIHKLSSNIVFNVNITVHYIQKFYQNQYLENFYLSKAMYNFDKTVDTFQVSAGKDGWTDDNSAILMVSGIHVGANYFFPSEVAMNITIGVQTYSISETPKGEGVFLLENVPGFNKNTLYTAFIETNQPVNYTLSFIISNSRIAIYEFEGTVVYKIQGTEITETAQYDVNLGCYMQTINTSLLYARSIPFTVTFTCSMDHYESKTKDLDFIVLERLTLISGSSTNIDFYPSIYVKDAINYTFSYTDALLPGTKITDLDEASYTMTKIGTGGQSVSYGSGDLYINANNEYIIDLNTETLAVGRYTIWILLDKQNYESKQAIIFLIVNEREIDYDLGDMFEEKQTSVVKGETITLSIELTDPTKGDIPLKGAKVILEIGDDELEFEEVEDGVYELEFDTKDYEAFFTSNTLTGIITVSKANYTSEEIDITIVIEMEEIEVIPGVLSMPILYFLLIIAAIGSVVGSLATYKYIQIMKIPIFVKKIKAMKRAIQKSTTISESLSFTDKETYMINMVSDKWESLGISLEDILGITAKKGKKLPIIMGKTIVSQKSPDLIPRGLILMRWNERIGPEIVVKDPKDINISQKTLMQIYSTHEYSGETGMINLIVGNLNIASYYYTGQEKEYYLVLILDIEDDADAYEGGMIDVIQVLLQNLEDDSYVQLIPSLFQRLAIYPTFNNEQHLLLTYRNVQKRMILNRLRDEGVIAKSEIMIWLRDKHRGGFINLDATIVELMKREFIKQISIKGMPSELSFLTGDLFMLRVPPVELIKNPIQRGLPSHLSKIYLNEVRKFFDQYRPTEFDNIKIIDILANPEVYQTFQLLRTAIVTNNELDKLKKKGVDDISHVLKLLWDTNMIKVFQDKSGTEYYCLISDFYIKLIFPKYLLEVIKREYDQKSQSDKVLIEYLNILEDTYLNIKSEEKSK